jgi:hypothetical protein
MANINIDPNPKPLGSFYGGSKCDGTKVENLETKTTLVAAKSLNLDKVSSLGAQNIERSRSLPQLLVNVKTGENSPTEIKTAACAQNVGISNASGSKQTSDSPNLFISESKAPPIPQKTTLDVPHLTAEEIANLPPEITESDFAIIKRMSPNMTVEDLKAILQYVNENKDRIINGLNTSYSRESEYVRPTEKNGLKRAIQFNKDGTVLIHFNRQSQKDNILGKGGNKVVKFAWDVTNKTPIAVARIPDRTLFPSRIQKAVEEELSIWNEFTSYKKMYDEKGNKLKQKVTDEGIAELRQYAAVIGKDGLTKHLFIQPIYNQGDLGSFIEKNSLPMETKKSMARQMLQSCSLLGDKSIGHYESLVHMDIKPGNFLVSKTEKTDTQPESIKVVLADFGLSKRKKDFTGPRGTPQYMPPEYLSESLRKSSLEVSEKNDSWALGVTLFELFTGKDPSWFDNYYLAMGLKQEEVDLELQQIPEELRPLLIDLLKVKPEERLTIKEAQKRHGALL